MYDALAKNMIFFLFEERSKTLSSLCICWGSIMNALA